MLQARSIQGIVILVIGIFIALWLGMALVTNQIETLLKVGGAGLLLICAFLGNRIWILVPITGAFSVLLIRGFSTTELAQGLFIVFTVLLFLMRKLSARWSWKETDWWVLLLALIVAQVYFRNPVGLNIFGAATVGAKPYFLVALAFMTMLILGNMKIKAGDLKWVMWLTILGGILSSPARLLRGEFGAGQPADEALSGGTFDTGGADRKGHLTPLAITPARILVCYISPLRGLFHPFWCLVIVFTMAAAAMTGYRNVVAYVGLLYLAGIAYHGGTKSMLASALLGSFALAAIALINLIYPLPPNVQRALSPFPGTWEERYVQQAAASTEWRVEMWKEALLTDHWIENKWLGDGLGMSKIELTRSQNLTASNRTTGISGLNLHQENIMIDGNYHSGPVQTIRTVGYAGLAVLMLTMIRLAVSTHRLILRAKGTQWFPVALFFGIPMIIEPFMFTFIYGEFGTNAAKLFIGCAMIKLLHANLPLPEYVFKRYRHVPLAVRNSQRVQEA